MKPYNTLTRLGQIRRLRKLAEKALDAYGLNAARLTFLHYQGNVIFRVDLPDRSPVKDSEGIYMPGRYLLRILSICDQEMIRSELVWLSALSQEVGLAVPEPVPALDGRLLVPISTTGIPNGRVVTLMRWVEGRQLSSGLRVRHVSAIGELMGKLHNFAAGWDPPQGFKRFDWDWGGLFSEEGLHYSIEDLVDSMPERYRAPFTEVSRLVREVMEAFGKGPEVYGLIHADMYMENLLFKFEQPRAIDFEDCGFGYWMFDIGVVLSQWWGTEEWGELRSAFLDGYTSVRPIVRDQLAHLELFIASVYAISVLWSTGFIKNNPAMRVEYEAWRDADGKKLLLYSVEKLQ